MQIKVKCSCGEGNCPEWAIIDLQGVVEAQPSVRDSLQNLEIGRLCHSSSQVGSSLILNSFSPHPLKPAISTYLFFVADPYREATLLQLVIMNCRGRKWP